MLSPSTDALTTGTALQRVDDRLDDERQVGELRARALVLGLLRLANPARRARSSTSNTECTCADVRRLSTMCSAIFLRITDIGYSTAIAGARTRGGATGTAGAAAAAGALRLSRRRRSRMSSLGHAAGDAGAVNLRDIDVVLLRDLAHERRRALRGSSSAFLERRLRAGGRGAVGAGDAAAGRCRRGDAGAARLGARQACSGSRSGARPRCRSPNHRDDAVDRNRLAFLDADLGRRRRRPATGSPRRPCRSRSRTAARRGRPGRRLS